MKRKLLACLLTLCLLLSMVTLLGLTVAAADGETSAPTGTVASITMGTKSTNYKQNQIATIFVTLTRMGAEEEATLTLYEDIETPFGCSLQGNLTIDLNGHTLRTHDMIQVQKDASLTVTDGASEGKLISIDYNPIQAVGGNVYVEGGTVTSDNGDFAIVIESGALYLSGTPTIGKKVYTASEKSIFGTSGGDDAVEYTGETVTVYYGAKELKDGAVIVQDANGHFELERRGLNIGQSTGKDMIYSTSSLITWAALALAVLIILILLIILIIRKIVVKKKIAKLGAASLLPIPFMAGMGDLQQILVLVVGVGLLAMIIIFIVGMTRSGKKLKKAKAAAAERAAQPAEQPAEEKAAEQPAEEAVAEAAAEEEATEEAADEEAAGEEAAEEEATEEEATEEEAAEEEATEEEEAAEEPVAEETADEPAAEEETPEEEAAEEEAAEEEPAAEEEEPAPIVNTLVSVPVVDASGKTTSYTNYKKSFLARIVLSTDDTKERYNTLKNALLSYKKVTARTSWSYESIKQGRKQLAKFSIRGKTLCLFLAIDPATLENSKYNISNESDSKKFDTVPCRLRLTSKRSVKWGLELIAQLAEKEQLVPNAKYKEQNYIPESRSDEDMLAAGLIKEVK